MLMFRYPSLRFRIVLISVMLIISACTAHLSGKTAEPDENRQQLESAGAVYSGPQYTIGIIQFDDRAPAKVPGTGEAAISIFRTQIEKAGLQTIVLDDYTLKEADKSTALLRAGIFISGKVDAGSGFDVPDFRVSGVITRYSETEEELDATVSRKQSVVARVVVDYSFNDNTTGRPLVVESAAGEYRKTTTGVLGAGSSFDPDLRDGALRDALAKATAKIMRKLGSKPFQGRILDVDGPSLVLKAGRRSQLKEGTQLAAYRVSKALVDPVNGQVLGYRENKIGIIQISSHQNDNLSTATVVSGSNFQSGDVIKPIPYSNSILKQQ